MTARRSFLIFRAADKCDMATLSEYECKRWNSLRLGLAMRRAQAIGKAMILAQYTTSLSEGRHVLLPDPPEGVCVLPPHCHTPPN